MIVHSIEAALKCPLIIRTVVSTDDDKIAEISNKICKPIIIILKKGLPLGTAPYAVARHTFAIINDSKVESETEFWPEYLQDNAFFRIWFYRLRKNTDMMPG